MVTETFRQRIGRLLGGIPETKMPDPQTRVVGGGTENNPWARLGLLNQGTFTDPMKSAADRFNALKLWREIYMKGGPVAECINAYPLFVLSNGWELACEEGAEGLKDQVQAWLDQPHVDMDSVMWQGIVDAVTCGTAFQEIVQTRGGDVWGVVPRDASSFWIRYDAAGRIIGYDQITYEKAGVPITTPIEVDRMLTLTLFPVPGEVYGLSLIGRAYDDIMRDTDMVESLTKAMHRHGTPKQQWDIGTPENPAPDAVLNDVRKTLTDMGAKTDFVTTGTKVNMLDTTGITGAQEFNNITLTRLATALGVPEEILGLGRGSTEATATVRHRAFMDKISTIQDIVARTYSRKVIDRITGQPGKVWIEFKDPSPDDDLKKAQVYAALRTGVDPDAVFPADWCREQFGVPPDEDWERTPKMPPVLPPANVPAATGKGEDEDEEQIGG